VAWKVHPPSGQGVSRHEKKIIMPALGLSILTLTASACGTLGGAAVGAGAGAAVGAGTGHGAGKGALIGTGVGAAAGAVYDVTKK
jgi:osmotically inducible lipoprotein OsmB